MIVYSPLTNVTTYNWQLFRWEDFYKKNLLASINFSFFSFILKANSPIDLNFLLVMYTESNS